MTDNNINRLAELLEKAEQMPFCTVKEQANWLIANGVIVPPCKVGDKVYLVGIFTGQIIETQVIGIGYNESGIYLLCENFTITSVAEQLGKTVFLTKEEAKAELRKRSEDNE